MRNQAARILPDKIDIPEINGEMVHLRPATVEDCALMDDLDAYYGASRITGKGEQSERALVHTWVERSVAWSKGVRSEESGVGDPESRRTIAWSVLADVNSDDGDNESQPKVIGMIFLIDVDGWAKSARIQVMLGRDYRGRGYSRDAMPRVMTYGFAWAPAGLGLHRIWVSVPDKNARSLSVYQSLGFVKEGVSRDALWDDTDERYQDLVVLGTLADEFDPIRSLDAFGMHLIEDNPGVREALAAREHSLSIEIGRRDARTDSIGYAVGATVPDADHLSGEDRLSKQSGDVPADDAEAKGGETTWPYSGDAEKGGNRSARAWWRNLGKNRTRGKSE